MKQRINALVQFTVLAAGTLLCGCDRSANTSPSGETAVNVRSVAASPNRAYVATVYEVSGGGAAGFAYKCVNLRAATEPFTATTGVVFQMSGNSEPTVRWEAEGMLVVEHPKEASVLTSEPEWKDGTTTVQIRYVPQ